MPIRSSTLVVVGFFVILMSACVRTPFNESLYQLPNANEIPPIPADEEPLPPEDPIVVVPNRALFRIGTTERHFDVSSNVVCLVDETQQESVVLFRDENIGASLSLRLTKLSSIRSENAMNAENPSGYLSIALDNGSLRNRFRFHPSQSRCVTRYSLTETQFSGQTQCEGLVNKLGTVVNSELEWTCPLQTAREWSW